MWYVGNDLIKPDVAYLFQGITLEFAERKRERLNRRPRFETGTSCIQI